MAAMSATRRDWLERVVLFATLAVLVLLAWAHHFVQDDAFISFRYARHSAEGHGLTWNTDEPPIQGFTNLLWTLVVSAAMRLGVEPVATTYALGLASFAGTLLGTVATSRALRGSRIAAWMAMVWMGTNFSASSYATGGLETSAQTCLFTWATYFALRQRPLGLALASAVLLWTRLDSAIVAAILVGAVAWRARHDTRSLIALFAPIAFASAALVAFDLQTFGAVLPNTFQAKVPGLEPRMFQVGLEYVLAFLRHYGLLPYFLAVIAFWPRWRRSNRELSLPAACIALWVAYVIRVGGDFMEFRLLVPVLPLAFALLAVVLFDAVRSRPLLAALGGAVVLQSFVNEYELSDEPFLQDGVMVETVYGLRQHIEAPSQNWPGIGRELGRVFAGVPDVTIAVGGAGALPYYSNLRTIDIFGLNDAWIARHGTEGLLRPGHRRVAPVEYLVAQRVNLAWYDPHAPGMPADAVMVHIPITPQCATDWVYLVRSPAVDAVIRREGWTVTPIR
jgi:hypothetical protein